MSNQPMVAPGAPDVPPDFMEKYAIPCIRVALGVTYIWFGVLKLIGRSAVSDLVAKTLFFVPPAVAVQTMGIMEVVIGLGMILRVARRLTLALFFMQIAGTFAVLIIRPDEAFQGDNPLLLTERGEFVIKNLVLFAAGIAVATRVDHGHEQMR